MRLSSASRRNRGRRGLSRPSSPSDEGEQCSTKEVLRYLLMCSIQSKCRRYGNIRWDGNNDARWLGEQLFLKSNRGVHKAAGADIVSTTQHDVDGTRVHLKEMMREMGINLLS